MTYISIYVFYIQFNRMRDYEELLGADYVEHNVHRHGLDLTRAVSVLGERNEDILRGHVPVGKNKVGEKYKYHSVYHESSITIRRIVTLPCMMAGSHGLPGDDLR